VSTADLYGTRARAKFGGRLTMSEITWAKYPYVARNQLARALLELEVTLGHASNTIDAYARGRDNFLAFCERRGIDAASATREHVALWVRELLEQEPRRGSKAEGSPARGLANATLQQRATAVRLFFDYLIERGIRSDNPVGRGRYTPGKVFCSRQDRGLKPRHKRLPWIPDDEEWAALLRAVELEPLRNRIMFALAYDAALRREELCSLEVSDFDFAHKTLTVRAETSKSRATRVVPFTQTTARLLTQYFTWRRTQTMTRGRVFLSESRRNRCEPMSIWTWSKVAERIATMSGVERFTTHTLRHLCLTDLARSGWDLHEIATFAGHRSVEVTKDYTPLGGRELAL